MKQRIKRKSEGSEREWVKKKMVKQMEEMGEGAQWEKRQTENTHH